MNDVCEREKNICGALGQRIAIERRTVEDIEHFWLIKSEKGAQKIQKINFFGPNLNKIWIWL